MHEEKEKDAGKKVVESDKGKCVRHLTPPFRR